MGGRGVGREDVRGEGGGRGRGKRDREGGREKGREGRKEVMHHNYLHMWYSTVTMYPCCKSICQISSYVVKKRVVGTRRDEREGEREGGFESQLLTYVAQHSDNVPMLQKYLPNIILCCKEESGRYSEGLEGGGMNRRGRWGRGEGRI